MRREAGFSSVLTKEGEHEKGVSGERRSQRGLFLQHPKPPRVVKPSWKIPREKKNICGNPWGHSQLGLGAGGELKGGSMTAEDYDEIFAVSGFFNKVRKCWKNY